MVSFKRKDTPKGKPSKKKGSKFSFGKKKGAPAKTDTPKPPKTSKRQQYLVDVIDKIDDVCDDQEGLKADRCDDRSAKRSGVVIDRKPKTALEKKLMRWAKHLNSEGKTFEECPSCSVYHFIETRYTSKTIVFRCEGCGERYNLKV